MGQGKKRANQALRLVAILIVAALLCCCAQKPGPQATLSDEKTVEIFQRAEAYYRNFFFEKALTTYEDAIDANPAGELVPAALYKIAGIHLKQGRPEQAVLCFHKLQAEYPDSPFAAESIYNMGYCYFQAGDPGRALAAYENYLALGDASNKARVRFLSAQALSALGRYDDALSYYAIAANQQSTPKELVETLHAARELIDDHVPSKKLLEMIPKLADGLVSDYARYRAARDLVAAHERDAAKELLDAIDYRRARFRFYKHAQGILDDISSGGGFGSTVRVVDDAEAPRAKLSIGVILPLSGRYEVFGQQVLHGVMMGLEAFGSEAGDTRIEVIIRDTEGEPETARARVLELAKNPEVVAVIGPLLYKEADAAAEAAEEADIPLIALSRNEDLVRGRPWVFRNALTFKHQARALIQYADAHLGCRRFAVMRPDNDFGKAFSEAFIAQLDPMSQILVVEQSYSADETNFKDNALELKKSKEIDAIFIPDAASRIALIAPQLIFYGITEPTLLGPSSWNKDELAEKSAPYLTRAVLVDAFFAHDDDGKVSAFVQRFTDSFSEAPTLLSALGYDSVGMLARVGLSGNEHSRSAIRRGLLQIRAYQGITGKTRFMENGEVDKELYLLRAGKYGIEKMY